MKSEIDIKHILKAHAYQNIPLSFLEAYQLGLFALHGCKVKNPLIQIQSVSALCALHTKATYDFQKKSQDGVGHGHDVPVDASEQIAGICAAIFCEDIGRSEFGFLKPRVSYVMDNCGMGGDLLVTANVSTVSAFIAASGGIPILKHGSPANTDLGRHGSSDFMDLCLIDRYASKKEVEKSLEINNFGYTEALDLRYKHIHWQTHEAAKLPHMNDIIGPITNPADPQLLTSRLMGVNHLIRPEIIAKAYLILNQKGITNMKHALFVRGLVSGGGIDELSICKEGSQIVELRGRKIKEYKLYPDDFGLFPMDPALISPPSGLSKGDFSLKILKGEIQGSVIEMVLANAALLFYLKRGHGSWKKCYDMACEAYEGGKAYQKMLQVRKMIPKIR